MTELKILSDMKYLIPFGIALGTVLIVAVGYALYKGWMFSKWMQKQVQDEIENVQTSEQFQLNIIELIESQRDGRHFREHVKKAIDETLKYKVVECIKEHSESADAHSVYRRMNDAFVRTLVVEELREHNESIVSHHVALASYPDRKELNGAIIRMEQKVDSLQVLILEKLSHISEQIRELKRDK